MKVKAYIEHAELDCVLDTGATKSVISTRIVEKYNLKLQDSATQVTLANGIRVPGNITKALSVCIQNRYCKMSFIVLPHDTIDVIIGLDWFIHFNATIDPANGILKFPSESLILKEDDASGDVHYNVAVAELYEEADDLQGEMDWDLNKMEDAFQIVKQQYNIEYENDPNYIRLWEVIEANKSCFANDNLSLGNCTLEEISINTRDAKPIFQYAYRKSLKQREYIKIEVDEMRAAGIIRESHSPWASPVVLIPKKDGTWRFCVDYRKVNAMTVSDAYPLPRIADILTDFKVPSGSPPST